MRTKKLRGAYAEDRKKVVVIRVTEEEHQRLRAGAAIANRTVSRMVRSAALGHAWQLLEMRRLMRSGLTAEQAAAHLITEGVVRVQADPNHADAAAEAVAEAAGR